MARPDSGSREANIHVAWRLEQAKRAARAYASNQKLAALTVAGSVGTGLADRFSDLELDCYWLAPPSDLDRLALFARLVAALRPSGTTGPRAGSGATITNSGISTCRSAACS